MKFHILFFASLFIAFSASAELSLGKTVALPSVTITDAETQTSGVIIGEMTITTMSFITLVGFDAFTPFMFMIPGVTMTLISPTMFII